MPSRLRNCRPGYTYHVLNRGVRRQKLFATDACYRAFERLIEESIGRVPLQIYTYILMPNHWHFVVRPHCVESFSEFFQYLGGTHAKRFHAVRGSVGDGHVYQDRFKSFPVEDDDHFLALVRYVERNALSAGLVANAEDWPWSAMWRRIRGNDQWLTSAWPMPRPANWIARVNQEITVSESAAIKQCMLRGCPLGSVSWIEETVAKLSLQHTMRSVGRPRISSVRS